MQSEYTLIERAPSVHEYQRLRDAVNWGNVNPQATQAGLDHALYSICLLRGEEVVGCGRVIGDGGIYFYVQDIIVLPDHQGQGLGRRIMDAVMRFLEASAPPNAFVALMAAKGISRFYQRYGFGERPADAPGMYRIWPECGDGERDEERDKGT